MNRSRHETMIQVNVFFAFRCIYYVLDLDDDIVGKIQVIVSAMFTVTV